MEEKKKDILAERPELKTMPYSVPEGYFNSFKEGMRPCAETHHPQWKRTVPYISAAAAAALLVGVGLHMPSSGNDDEFTQEDFLVFSGTMGNTEYYMDQLADAEIADEDIIDYLIYSGVSAEEIEFLK